MTNLQRPNLKEEGIAKPRINRLIARIEVCCNVMPKQSVKLTQNRVEAYFRLKWDEKLKPKINKVPQPDQDRVFLHDQVLLPLTQSYALETEIDRKISPKSKSWSKQQRRPVNGDDLWGEK